MSLSHLRILIHEFSNKDPGIFPQEYPLIILDSKSDVCMAKNGKYTNHKSNIAIRVHFLRNGENGQMYFNWHTLQLIMLARMTLIPE